jgi:hypothetical protein
MLTVEEKYAGQMMKCPLCGGTFTVPGLPAAPAVPAAPPEVYSLEPEPAPPAAEPAPAPSPAPATPAATAPTPEPAAAPAPAPPPPEGYRRVFSIWFNPEVLQFIAPAALLLVFVLQLFAWVGVYPGGVAAATQSAWGIAFGGYTEERDMASLFRLPTEQQVAEGDAKDIRPGFSFLMFVYLLLFFPTLIVTVGCLVLEFVPIKMPPALEKVLPWRWGIVAALNLAVFLFLGLQLPGKIGLETSAKEWSQKQLENREKERHEKSVPRLQAEAERGRDEETARTFVFRLVVLLHLLAIVSAAMMFWIGQRGTRPLPRIDVMW